MPPRRTAAAKLADLPVERVPLAQLKPDPRNPRTHSDLNLDKIEASLRRFGQRKPLVVARDYTVVAGNGTLQVLTDRIGAAEAWVTVFPGTANEARAYAVADNHTAEFADWDPDNLAETLRDLQQLDETLLTGAGYDWTDLDELLAGQRDVAVTAADSPDGARPFTPAGAGVEDAPTRTLFFELPPWLFTWAAEALASYREDNGLESNTDALVAILEAQTGTPAPTEPSEVTAD